MLRSRLIVSLLLKDGGLVKTVKFKEPRYLGDPINTVRIFNEKEVDELAIFDISCTTNGKSPDFKLIESLAEECRMPLCYGGGIKSVAEAQRIFDLGVEKIAISSAAVYNPSLITEIARRVGSQSVVVVLDVKKRLIGGYEIRTHNGSKRVDGELVEIVKRMKHYGAGEIVINNITNDGSMKGYDLGLVACVKEVTDLPLTILGGAGGTEDVGLLTRQFGIIGAASGSQFVYKGKLKGVLMHYPDAELKSSITKFTSLK